MIISADIDFHKQKTPEQNRSGFHKCLLPIKKVIQNAGTTLPRHERSLWNSGACMEVSDVTATTISGLGAHEKHAAEEEIQLMWLVP